MPHQLIKSALFALGVLVALVVHGESTAQDSMVLTVAAPDGALWALPEGQAPVLIRRDLGRGATITDLAWSPVEPQLLVVRRETRGGEPYDSLVRIDLRSGDEEVLEEQIGPQARLLHPSWKPDGGGGIARLECCLERQVVRFRFPTRAGSPNRIETADFLPADQREVALAEAGFINKSGEIVISVTCCMGDEPESNPAGIYAVSEDFQSSRRLAPGDLGLPIGGPDDDSWLASLLPFAEGDGNRIVIVAQDGSSSELDSPADLPLSDHGVVLPDGTIAVATVPPGVLSLTQRYVDVWALRPTDTPARRLTEAYKTGFTAFGFTTSAVLRATPPVAQEGQTARPGGAATSPTRIFLSRMPESEQDFTIVFPVVRKPMTPKEALQTLINGPTEDEQAAGYYSELQGLLQGESTCDADFELTMESSTAVVRFCRGWASAGIGQDARVTSQITATLTQFPFIQKVRLLDQQGHCLMDMSGDDRCLRE
jgi:sporulation and spore germination protein